MSDYTFQIPEDEAKYDEVQRRLVYQDTIANGLLGDIGSSSRDRLDHQQSIVAKIDRRGRRVITERMKAQQSGIESLSNVLTIAAQDRIAQSRMMQDQIQLELLKSDPSQQAVPNPRLHGFLPPFVPPAGGPHISPPGFGHGPPPPPPPPPPPIIPHPIVVPVLSVLPLPQCSSCGIPDYTQVVSGGGSFGGS